MSTIDPAVTEKPEADKAAADRSNVASPAWPVRLLKEPLLHFLVLGAALFLAYSYSQDEESESRGQIVVSAGKVEHLATLFARTWQRPPTTSELQSLIDDYVREEVAYREGMAIGLDQNDTIIRRRIRQKLDFVAEDLASQLEPTDEELQQYLAEHQEDFRADPRLSFRQIFLDPEKQSGDLPQIVDDLVTKLKEDPSLDATRLGDRTLLNFAYGDVSTREVKSLLGKEFAEAIVDLQPNTWQGPIPSAYGAHLVIVDSFKPASQPKLEDVKAAVRREWEHERHRELTEEFYQGLLDKYDISVEWPALESGQE